MIRITKCITFPFCDQYHKWNLIRYLDFENLYQKVNDFQSDLCGNISEYIIFTYKSNTYLYKKGLTYCKI